MGRNDDATVATLPLDPETMDIVWENCPTGKVNFSTGEAICELRFNISQNPTHHSPTGFEVGYSGSGPSDFALSILNLFVPPGSDGQEPVKCWSGVCSQTAWDLHGDFKREFIATADREGGTIKGDVIRKWIADHPIERQITMGDVLDGDA